MELNVCRLFQISYINHTGTDYWWIPETKTLNIEGNRKHHFLLWVHSFGHFITHCCSFVSRRETNLPNQINVCYFVLLIIRIIRQDRLVFYNILIGTLPIVRNLAVCPDFSLKVAWLQFWVTFLFWNLPNVLWQLNYWFAGYNYTREIGYKMRTETELQLAKNYLNGAELLKSQ